MTFPGCHTPTRIIFVTRRLTWSSNRTSTSGYSSLLSWDRKSLLSLEKFWQLRYSIANFSITWNLFQFQQISSAMLKKKLFDSLETWYQECNKQVFSFSVSF